MEVHLALSGESLVQRSATARRACVFDFEYDGSAACAIRASFEQGAFRIVVAFARNVRQGSYQADTTALLAEIRRILLTKEFQHGNF